MTEAHRPPNYIAIFWMLLILTLIEVGVAYMPIAKAPQVATLIVLAIMKALLVALFFMHLKFDRRLLAVVAVVPLALTSLVTLLLVVSASFAGH